MPLCVIGRGCSVPGAAEADQRKGTQILAQAGLQLAAADVLGHVPQPAGVFGHGRRVPLLAGVQQTDDSEEEFCLTVAGLWYRLRPLLGQAQVALGCLQRPAGQLVGGGHYRKLGIGRRQAGREPGHQLVDGADPPVQGVMMSMARGYVPSGAVAEEVVQDAWVAVLRGIDRFERRSSFRTWLFRILVNRAISAGVRERRSVPVDDMGPVVDTSWFDAGGSWQVPLEPWADEVDDKVIAAKIAARIVTAIDELPLQQREVVTVAFR
jgi:RNA polymerase sigma factor (sigma-70 family)